MEIRQLRYFVSAARHLNFTKAAKECFIVQSAMTAQIANLEEELGVRLFDRLPRGLALTDAGSFFLTRAKALVQEAQRTEAEMNAFQAGYEAVLRVGYYGEAFKADLIEILRTYRREEPYVKVLLYQMDVDRLKKSLQDGALDVVIGVRGSVFAEEEWAELDLIAEIGPSLVVGKDHPLTERESVTMAELADLPRIRFSGSIGREDPPERMGERGERFYGAVWDHTSAEILVASGYAVSIWAERLSQNGSYPDLRFIKIKDNPTKQTFALVWRKDRLTPEGERFRSLVRRHMEDG